MRFRVWVEVDPLSDPPTLHDWGSFADEAEARRVSRECVNKLGYTKAAVEDTTLGQRVFAYYGRGN